MAERTTNNQRGELSTPSPFRVGLCLCFLVLALGPAAEIDDLIVNAPGQESYPEAAALILLDRRIVTINRNNSATSERYLVVKIFEDRGKDEFGEITQRYNKDGAICEVLEARTYKPDRSVVRPEKRAIADVSAPEVFDAPAYTSAMLKVVSFPALEKDAVIEYRVRVRPTKSAREDYFSGSVSFGGHTPALKREFRLVVPQGKSFASAWKNIAEPPAPQVETLAGSVTYTWAMTNTPQILREPGMPNLARLVPMLTYSSCESWRKVADKLKQEFGKGLDASSEVKRLADSLASGKSRPEAIRDIFLYVTRKIRNIPLDYGRAGFDTRKASQVLKWRYGDCRDKNCLLASLLRQAGVYSFPAALSRDADPAEAVPTADAFNWLVTIVPADSASFDPAEPSTFELLDPFAEHCRYGRVPEEDAGARALFLDGKAEGLTIASPSLNNLCVTTADLVLDADGNLSGTVTTEADGFYDRDLRSNWRDQTPTDRRRSMSQTAAGIKPGTRIDTFWFSDLSDLTQPASSVFSFSAPRYAVSQKGELSLQVPTPAVVSDPLFRITSSARRTNPVETKPPRTYTYRCNIKLPPGVKPDILPDSVSVSDTGGSSEAGWTKTAEGVSFYYTIRLLKQNYSVPEYAGLKAVADAVSRPQLRDIYFLR